MFWFWPRIRQVYEADRCTTLLVVSYAVISVVAVLTIPWLGFFEPNGVDIFSPLPPPPFVDILELAGIDDQKSKLLSNGVDIFSPPPSSPPSPVDILDLVGIDDQKSKLLSNGVDIFSPPPPPSPLALAEIDDQKSKLQSAFQEAMLYQSPLWRKYSQPESTLDNWLLRRLYFVDSEERHILDTLGWGTNGYSCAVVGNVGRVRNAGDKIDAHDNVGIAGNRQNVGRKTNVSLGSSIHMLSDCVSIQNTKRYGDDITVVYLSDIVRSYLLLVYCETTVKDIIVTDPRFDLLSMKIAKYYSLKRWFKDNRTIDDWIAFYNGKFHYSSGLQAVILAFVSCQNISLYGFALDSAKTNEDMYYEEMYDYEAEMDFYQDLAISTKRIPFLNKFGLTDNEVQIH